MWYYVEYIGKKPSFRERPATVPAQKAQRAKERGAALRQAVREEKGAPGLFYVAGSTIKSGAACQTAGEPQLHWRAIACQVKEAV